MVEFGCGEVYLSTYWGSRRGLTFTDEYQGDLLFRLDPAARTASEVGVILPEHGVASLAGWSDGGLLYAEAADPFGQKVGSFVVIDAATGDQVFEDDDAAHGGYRSIAVDAEGRAYITWNDTSLARYDPATNTLAPLDVTMPGGTLRAVTLPDANGTVFAVTKDPPAFFSLSTDGEIEELGAARGYTTSIALSPDGSRFYYVPDAHGGSWREGTPLIAVDTSTGDEQVIAELQPVVGEALGLQLGGTYNVTVDPSGERVYVALNAGDLAAGESVGEVVLAVVTLP
jgi:sugar lactone lactonase YvrE